MLIGHNYNDIIINDEDSIDEVDRKFCDNLMSRAGNDPRSFTLLATAAIERLLGLLIDRVQDHSELQPNQEGAVKKRSLAVMITTARLLGIIGEREAARCHAIRNIRNKFAHNDKIYISDRSLAPLVDLLRDLRLHGEEADASMVVYMALREMLFIARQKCRDAGVLPSVFDSHR